MNLMALLFSSIVVVILGCKIKEYDASYGNIMSVAGCIMVLTYVVGRFSGVSLYIERLMSYIKSNELYVGVIIKMLGVSYVCQLSSDICKDAGYGAMAFQVEMAGKVTLVLLGMPVLMSVIDLVVKLLEG